VEAKEIVHAAARLHVGDAGHHADVEHVMQTLRAAFPLEDKPMLTNAMTLAASVALYMEHTVLQRSAAR